MYDAVCLASGGLDSIVCLHLLKSKGIRALPLFVDYGQRNKRQEFNSLLRNVREAKFAKPIVLDVSDFGKAIQTGLTDRRKRIVEDAFTPNRNLLFLTLAGAVASTRGISSIVLGFLSEKSAIFPDQSERFLVLAQKTLTESLGAGMAIVCPLRDMFKKDVVKLSSEFGISSTYSCHAGKRVPCGKCISCREFGSI